MYNIDLLNIPTQREESEKKRVREIFGLLDKKIKQQIYVFIATFNYIRETVAIRSQETKAVKFCRFYFRVTYFGFFLSKKRSIISTHRITSNIFPENVPEDSYRAHLKVSFWFFRFVFCCKK